MNKEKGFSLEATFITDASLVDVQTTIGLPDKVAGLKIIDIGSGASTAVEELAERGAQVYGIDPIYTDNKKILASYRRAIKMGNTNPSFTQRLKGSVEKLMSDYLNNGRYVAASATELPFKDSSIDLIYSHQCLSAFLIRDRAVFLRAIAEAMRALRAGGQLRIHPWYLPPHEREFPPSSRRTIMWRFEWSTNEINNVQAALAYLRRNKHPFVIEDNVITTSYDEFWEKEVDIVHQPRLVITK